MMAMWTNISPNLLKNSRSSINNLQLTQVPVAKTGMLIRRPVADVFEAFIDPDLTPKFWFTKSSGPLEVGKETKWEWEMYNASALVTPKVIEPNKRIVIEWDAEESVSEGGTTRVVFEFEPIEGPSGPA